MFSALQVPFFNEINRVFQVFSCAFVRLLTQRSRRLQDRPPAQNQTRIDQWTAVFNIAEKFIRIFPIISRLRVQSIDQYWPALCIDCTLFSRIHRLNFSQFFFHVSHPALVRFFSANVLTGFANEDLIMTCYKCLKRAREKKTVEKKTNIFTRNSFFKRTRNKET